MWRSLETVGVEGAAGLAERAERNVAALPTQCRNAARQALAGESVK
jgi:hypothetical protein